MSFNQPDDSTKEHQQFLKGFQELVAKHPAAARRFALADLDQEMEPIVTSIPTVVFECTRNEDGAVFCRRVREQ